MDYEKKYKEALNRASKLKVQNPFDTVSQMMEYIFPNLKESENERIRKSLIDMLKNDEKCYLKEIAWLEKQDNKFIPEDVSEAALQYVDNCPVDGEVLHDNITEPYWNNHSMMNAYKAGWLEKQGEQKPTLPKWKYKNDNIPLLRDSIILNKYGCVAKSPSGAIVSDVWVIDYDELAKLPKEEIENQDEQKQTDNTEQKLEIKKDQWYICIRNLDDKYGTRAFDKGCIYHSTKDETLMPGNSNIPFEIKYCANHYFRLWTIQDAKDGDVLVDVYGNIGIFEQYDDFDWTSYCSLGVNGGFQHFKVEHENEKTYPATKEQRELLFQKMKEAGYEWDSEHKQLKKIEQTSAWSNTDLISLGYLAYFVDQNGDKFYGKNKSNVVKWIQSLANLTAPQQEWSEEDENFLKTALWHISHSISLGKSTDIHCDTTDWLKSLKGRVQSKKEWCEEDKVRINRIVNVLEHLKIVNGSHLFKKDVDCLKSLTLE